MNKNLINWNSENDFQVEVVAYQNINDGKIISKKEYEAMVEREIVEMWHVMGRFGKREYGTFENFRKCMLEIPDTDFIPLYNERSF